MEIDYLAKNNSNLLKLVFAFVVLLHHTVPTSGINFVDDVTANLGYLAVAVFFFLSGYGLAYSNKNKDGYLRCFWRNRIVPMFLICLITAGVYLCFDYIVPGVVDLTVSWRVVTIIPYGWYLEAILVSYLAFWLAYQLNVTSVWRYTLITLLITIYAFAYYSGGNFVLIKDGSIIVFSSIYAFVLGLIWFDNKEKIDQKVNNSRRLIIAVCASVFAFAAFFIVMFKLYGTLTGTVSRALSSLLFVITIVLMVKLLSPLMSKYRYLTRGGCTQRTELAPQ